MLKKILLLTACILLNITSVFGAEALPSDATPKQATVPIPQTLEIIDPWARVPLTHNNTAAYMTIHNPTDKEYTIIGASAAMVANDTELHKSFVDEKGVSKMSHIDKIVVPAKTDVALAPGGLHVMLINLKKSLKVGDQFIIKLKLKDEDAIDVKTFVK